MKSPVAIEISEAEVAESSLNEPEEGEIETQVVESSAEGSEEGEIVDDLEVVSDDSITFSPQKSGKSLGKNLPDLPPLSSLTDIKVVVKQRPRSRIKSKRELSKEYEREEYSNPSPSRVPVLELEDISPSVSDASLSPDLHLQRKKKHSHYHHKCIRKRRNDQSHKQSVESESETDDEIYLNNRAKKQTRATISTGFQESHVNKKLQKQLRAAISVNSQESHSKNTLKDKLFAMAKKTSNEIADTPSEIKVTSDTFTIDFTEHLAAEEVPTNNKKSIGSSEEEVSKHSQDQHGTEKQVLESNNDEDSSNTQSSEHSDKKEDKDEDNDSELIELRLEALKTALLNKYKVKKQNKAAENETNKENNNSNVAEHTVLELNKEHSSNSSDKSVDIMSHDKPIENELKENNEYNPQSPEEDEDVLRALLLASMSNKITRKVPDVSQNIGSTKNAVPSSKSIRIINEVIIKPIKEPPLVKPFKIKEIQKPPSLAKVNFRQNKINKRINLPKVKPLIINVNSDSDTEDDLFSTQHFERCMTDSSKTKTTEKMSPVANDVADPKVQNTPILKSIDKSTQNATKLADLVPDTIAKIAQPRDDTLKSADLDIVKVSSVVESNKGSNIVPTSEKLGSNIIIKSAVNVENKTDLALVVPVPLKNKTDTSNSEKLSPKTNLSTDVANKNKSSESMTSLSSIESSTELFLNKQQTPLVILPSIERSVDRFLQKQRALAQPLVPPSTQSSVDKFSMIESSVEKFLREQRARVESEKKSKISKTIITASEPCNDRSILRSKLPSTQVTSSKNINNIIVTRSVVSGAKKIDLTPINKSNNRMPNSAVKLLPKNKQIEYQKLLLKLRNAEKNKMQNKRPRGRRSSQRLSMSENNNQPSFLSKTNISSSQKQRFGNPKTPDAKNNDTEKETSPESGESRALEERKSDALMLHSTLKQMQEKINGRLQIQEKYNSLKPLMKKINEVSKEQKHWNQQVKKLLDELAEAKNNQEKVHQEMTDSVKQLVEGKKKIDEEGTLPNEVATSKPFACTDSVTHPSLKILTATSNSPDINLLKKDTNNAVSHSATSDSDINIGDPNDIEIVISKTNAKKVVRKALLFNEQTLPKKVESTKIVNNLNKIKVNNKLTKNQKRKANRMRRKGLINSVSSLENKNIKSNLDSTHTQNLLQLGKMSLHQPVSMPKTANTELNAQDQIKQVNEELSNSLSMFSSIQNKKGNQDQAKRATHKPYPWYQSSSPTDQKEKEPAKNSLLGNMEQNSRLITEPIQTNKDNENELRNASPAGQKRKEPTKNSFFSCGNAEENCRLPTQPSQKQKDHENKVKDFLCEPSSLPLLDPKEKEHPKNASLLRNVDENSRLTDGSSIQNKTLSNVDVIQNKSPKLINDSNAVLSVTTQEDPNLQDDIINRIDNMVNDSYSLLNKLDRPKKVAVMQTIKSSPNDKNISPMIKNLDAAITHLSNNLLSLYTANTSQPINPQQTAHLKNIEVSEQESATNGKPNNSSISLKENINFETSNVLINKIKKSNVEFAKISSGNEISNQIPKKNIDLTLEGSEKKNLSRAQKRKQKQPLKNSNTTQTKEISSTAETNTKNVSNCKGIQNSPSQTNLPVQSNNSVNRPNLIEVHISPTLEQQARRTIRKKEYFRSINDPKGDENKGDDDDDDIEIIEHPVEVIVIASDTDEENPLENNTQGPTLAEDVPQNVAHNGVTIEIDNENASKNDAQNPSLTEITLVRNVKDVAQNIDQRISIKRSGMELSLNDAQVAKKLKYVSPLDYSNRSLQIDPFSIMCPFEVMGRCRDPECAYKHFVPK